MHISSPENSIFYLIFYLTLLSLKPLLSITFSMASTTLAIIAIVIAVAAVVAVLYFTGVFDTESDLEIETPEGELEADVDTSAANLLLGIFHHVAAK